MPKSALFRLAGGIANQALHQTPDTSAVPAGAGGGAGELVVRVRHDVAWFACIHVLTCSTRYVPTGPYAGMLPLR